MFNKYVKDLDSDLFINNVAHKLAAGLVGCASAELNKQSCEAGALGAAVGEMVADYLSNGVAKYKIEDNKLIEYYDSNTINSVLNSGKLISGLAALLIGLDVNATTNSAALSIINNGMASRT